MAAITASADVLIGNGDRIAFLGDSITSNGNRPAGYVNMVMKGLEIAGVKAEKVPAGVSGHKSNEENERLRRAGIFPADLVRRALDRVPASAGSNR